MNIRDPFDWLKSNSDSRYDRNCLAKRREASFASFPRSVRGKMEILVKVYNFQIGAMGMPKVHANTPSVSRVKRTCNTPSLAEFSERGRAPGRAVQRDSGGLIESAILCESQEERA